MLIVQILITQWDKSQRTDAHKQQRLNRQDKTLVNTSSANCIAKEQLVIDMHGDDEGKRIQFHLDGDDFYIDRFHFSLSKQILEYKTAQSSAIEISHLKDGWVQCRYNWRRRVEQGGFIYWLYEDVTLNACFVDEFQSEVFMSKAPERVFTDLTLTDE